MPEELLIALAILGGIVWVAVKLFGASAKALDEIQKNIGSALARWRKGRFAKKKAALALRVQICQPNDLA